jgi:glycosyltransferase involved in cell wall biosynthesis
VHFLGRVEEARKYDILRSSECFIFPSYEEGWAIVITEAMAAGLPVIAYDLPAYKPFGNAIITVPLGDKAAFSKSVLAVLHDDTLRADLRRKGFRLLERFDWERIAEDEWLRIAQLNSSKCIAAHDG